MVSEKSTPTPILGTGYATSGGGALHESVANRAADVGGQQTRAKGPSPSTSSCAERQGGIQVDNVAPGIRLHPPNKDITKSQALRNKLYPTTVIVLTLPQHTPSRQ